MDAATVGTLIAAACAGGALAVGGACLHALRRVLRGQGALDTRVQALADELAQARGALRVLAQRPSEAPPAGASAVDAAARLARAQPELSHAELVRAFGLSRAEAELLVRMHRPASAPGPQEHARAA